MAAWSLQLWARGFFLSGFSTRVGWGAATLHGLPTRSCISSGMPSEVPGPRNTPSRAEHPAPTVATSAHSPPLTAALFPGAHRVPPGTELLR